MFVGFNPNIISRCGAWREVGNQLDYGHFVDGRSSFAEAKR
jgi:hypothetical protein